MNRFFGRPLKNGQHNYTSNSIILGAKLKPTSLPKKTNSQPEDSLNKKAKPSVESDAISLSNIISEKQGLIPAESREQREYKEYKDLALAGEKPHIDEGLVKVGNYFVKKTSDIEVPLLQTKTKYFKNYLEGEKIERLSKSDYFVMEDPQYVVEYVTDIFRHLREAEKINQAEYGYIANVQDDINDRMRAVLIDWVIEVHQKFKLYPETLYLTINIIDRYLNLRRVDRNQLQLVSVGAMLIASKYEEIYPPEVRDFVYVTDKTYSKEQILEMEYKILSGLSFEMLHVSPYIFLKRFHFVTGETLRSFFLAQYVLEFSLLEYKMLRFPSSVKAAASLYVARKILKVVPAWTAELIQASTYHDKDLKACVRDICKILELIPRITLKACIAKFSSSKFMEVAKINMFN